VNRSAQGQLARGSSEGKQKQAAMLPLVGRSLASTSVRRHLPLSSSVVNALRSYTNCGVDHTNTKVSVETVGNQKLWLKPAPDQPIKVLIQPALQTNYSFILHDSRDGCTIAFDTPDPNVIKEALEEKQWTLSAIANTHGHADHTQGNDELADWTESTLGSTLAVHAPEDERVPRMTHKVSPDETIKFSDNLHAQVINLSGHTPSQVGYYFRDLGIVFSGDALFPLGCGRLFGGTALEAYESLERLANLPDDTLVFGAHEYAVDNALFAVSVGEPYVELRNRVSAHVGD
jgi:hydroxyacylglutathione hydrolase